MSARIRSSVRRFFCLRSLENRELPATGLTLWSPLADDPHAWARAATVWTPEAHSAVASTNPNKPHLALPMQLDETSARATFADVPEFTSGSPGLVIALPDPHGELQRFRVWEVETMEPALAAQFPQITTYRGQGIDDPGALLAADFTPAGFHAQILSGAGYSIAPTQTVSDGQYSAFFAINDVVPHGPGCLCPICTAAAASASSVPAAGTPPSVMTPNFTFGANLRTFRLAVAATGEYTADAGGTVTLALSAINTVINSVNAVYERDCGIHMNLVANNNLIIYTDSTTDPYTGNNLNTMIGQNQANIDAVIGTANYDIGHVFGGLNQGGLAALGVVGAAGNKARGGSTDSGGQPTGNWMTFVTSHEMGHQFSAGHSFNGVSPTLTANRMGGSAWEPGSGDSIMAYPHVTENGQAYSNVFQTYFHTGSIEQIINYGNAIPSVGTTTATGNSAPTVNAGADRTIPANTPFQLTMTATDPDGDPLLLGFDDMDLGPALSLGAPDNGSSPLFRSYFPTLGSFTRTFPNLTDLLANNTYAPETLPSTNRTLTFRASARDNKAGGGAVTTDDVKYTVVNTGSAFAVTAPNTAVSYTGGSTQTVTWNVAGTTANGINTATVDILLSFDGGLSFPITLAAGTANDGTETVTIPNTATSTARIKVQAVGNIFFDVSNANFTISAITLPLIVTNTNDAGAGSLRAVIAQANSALGPDTITFDSTVFASATTIMLSTGEIAISEGLTIVGPAARVTVDANKNSRIFNMSSAATGAAIVISGLTITRGSTSGDGGAIFVGDEALTLIDCVVTGNTAAGDGGGINVQSTGAGTLAALTLKNTAITGNTANDDGGGFYVFDGGSVLVEASTISGNKATAGDGGGFYFYGVVTGGGLTVRNSTIALNTAGNLGGGIGLLGSGSTGTLNIQSATIVGNSASSSGGGIYRAANSMVISVDSSIVAGNINAVAPDIFSAGTVNQSSSAVGSNTGFTQTNLGGNLAFGVNLLLGTLGVFGGATQTVPLLPGSPAINTGSSSITTDQRGNSRVSNPDMGAFESQGFNFVTSGSGQSTVINTAFANPLALTVNPVNAGEPVDGGIITFTPPGAGASASLSGSTVAIAAGKTQVTATANGAKGTYDIVASAIGAGSASFTLTNTDPIEAPSLVVSITIDVVDNTDNKTSLREAIAYANSKQGADTITFDPTVFASPQMITLTGGQLSLFDKVTIAGPGANLLTISGGNASRIFFVTLPVMGLSVTLSGMTIANGSSTSGAACYVFAGDLTLSDCAVVGNSASGFGGGVHMQAAGTLTVRRSTLSGNTSARGAALDFYYYGSGNLVLEDSTISGNSTSGSGGGVFFGGTGGITIRNSTIANNTSGSGGGIFRDPGSSQAINLTSSIVSGNSGGSSPDIYSTVAVTANFSAIGASGGHTTIGADNLAYGTDLKLGPLADNGGSTRTHALLPGSPCINAGSNPASLTADQRGGVFVRVSGVAPDIGAFEVQPTSHIQSVQVNDGSAQRSRVTSLTITFDQPVTMPANPADAFRLKRQSDNAVVTLSGTLTGNSVTLTFAGGPVDFGSLADGRYTLTAFAGLINGSNFDGNGDSVPGDNYVLIGDTTNKLFRLYGDADGNGLVDGLDFGAFRLAFNTNSFAFDFDGNGIVDGADFGNFRAHFNQTI